MSASYGFLTTVIYKGSLEPSASYGPTLEAPYEDLLETFYEMSLSVFIEGEYF